MIYVSQGHEDGIGLEVFFKSCLMMSQERLNKISLVAYRDSVEKTIKTMRLPFEIGPQHMELSGLRLKCDWQERVHHSQSLSCLKFAMEKCDKSGVLFTLPTSKDQFAGHAGHTEFFREYYKNDYLGMFFSGPRLKVLLLSDHIPLRELSTTLTQDLLYNRLSCSIASMARWKIPFAKILVSGLNPHAGEGGLIGDEDSRVAHIIQSLRKRNRFKIAGPFPGDSMYLEKTHNDDLLVYCFHDQGLGVFKGLKGLIGANITLGLPYPRVSPDHGTSFGLFGRNLADHRGCAFALKEAETLLGKIFYGENPGN